MFYMNPLHVSALFQHPTSVETSLQLSIDPEVVYVNQELRALTVASEDREAIVPEELRRATISGDDVGAREVPRLRRT